MSEENVRHWSAEAIGLQRDLGAAHSAIEQAQISCDLVLGDHEMAEVQASLDEALKFIRHAERVLSLGREPLQ